MISGLHDPKKQNFPTYKETMNNQIWRQCSKREFPKDIRNEVECKKITQTPKHETCCYKEKKWNSWKSQNFPQWVPQKWVSNRNYRQQRHPCMPMSTQNIALSKLKWSPQGWPVETVLSMDTHQLRSYKVWENAVIWGEE